MTSVPQPRAEPDPASPQPAASSPILQPGRTCWVVSRAEASGLLVDGEDYFAAFHRAASSARDSILLAGWQFDSTVSLLRGAARDGVAGEVRLLPFLRSLCEANPALQIRILCWDYSPAYAFQREWWQDLKFNRAAPGQLLFLFDDRTALGGSHHQKFVVIDGALAFLGSMDLCHARWDRRLHPVHCDERCEPYDDDVTGPYHEVQAWLEGPVVRDLQELFAARWQSAGGEPFELPPPRPDLSVRLDSSIDVGAADVGLSRTMGATLVPEQASIREIEQLHVDAIACAGRSIYIESQYFGARSVHRALVERLRQPGPRVLDVVIVCPREMHSFTERMAMQEAQNVMFHDVRAAGAAGGHRVGIYHVVSCEGDEVKQTYIHSKVMIVDDRLLTVGSANLNNRSLGLDSELNVSWEAAPGDARLERAIRRVRVALLAEHTGRAGSAALLPLHRAGHVRFLDELASRDSGRLRIHVAPDLADVPPSPADAGFTLLDPERPLEEYVFERLAPTRREALAGGVRVARRRFAAWRRRRRTRVVAANRPRDVARRPYIVWTALVRISRRLLLPLTLLAIIAALVWAVIGLLIDTRGT